MALVTDRLDAPPDAVAAVMRDGWTYAAWVVGASRVRGVDAGWPAPGSRVHHSVGTWPLLIDDHTRVLECTLAPDGTGRLVLQARAWPAGEATVAFELAADGSGTRVTLSEDATRGPATLLPRPIRSALLRARNRETLQRLAPLAQARAQAHVPAEDRS